MDAYKNMWKNGLNFKDRTSKHDYWYAVGINFLILIIIGLMPIKYIYTIYSLLSSIVVLSLTVRRFHDVNKSGFYILLGYQ